MQAEHPRWLNWAITGDSPDIQKTNRVSNKRKKDVTGTKGRRGNSENIYINCYIHCYIDGVTD